MDGFEYKNEQLYAGQLSVKEIAECVGTPFYLYSAQGIENNFLRLKNAFGQRKHHIHYAIKANSNIALLAYLKNLGAGFDVVSAGELIRALKAGSLPEDIVFSGVGKSEAEIRLALQSNIHSINIESAAELERLQDCAADLNVVAQAAIRVNPDVDAGTHEYISTGLKENKFGVDRRTALELYQQMHDMTHVNPVGIAYHIGSQITTLEPLTDALTKVLTLIDELGELGISIKNLDMGGGLGIRYEDENPPTFENYVKTLVDSVDQHHSHLLLSIEPGRSIIGNAGILVTKVEYLKTNNEKHFAVVDAAMNDLLRPALYKAWMKISEVDSNSDAVSKHYDIVGPVCESADFLGKNRELAIEQGDLLAVQSSGAYSMSMSSNYNSRPRPAEVLVDNANFHIIRQRERYEDLFADETIPDFTGTD